jgi:hypothetical protein
VPTHFLAVGVAGEVPLAAKWIREGAIGTLREVHNWSNRPVWPQYPAIPTDKPPVPAGFGQFGAGAVADMGHYSLWTVFTEFSLDAPIMVESSPSHVCTLSDQVSIKVRNDYSFPAACTIRFMQRRQADSGSPKPSWMRRALSTRRRSDLEIRPLRLTSLALLTVAT